MFLQQQNIETLNYGRKVYDFMRWSYVAFSVSIILLTVAITIAAIKGFNWGLDFIGGTAIEFNLEKPVDLNQIRVVLKYINFNNSLVQNFNGSHDILIRLPLIKDCPHQELVDRVINAINQVTNQHPTIKHVEFIGPSVGNDLAQDSSVALLVALLCILFYVCFRFEWRLATGIVLALVHDIVITLGILSLYDIEINMTIIASLMSVIGYSLNDSIIVSDRIRENFYKINQVNAYDIFNISLTQVLSRTIITSATTMTVVLILLFFGGVILRGFSITLFVGMLIGTISSIYVASTLALKLGIKREHLFYTAKEEQEEY